MGNQRGEVVTIVMVAMMTVMMLFGGMHLMHGGPPISGGDYTQSVQKNIYHDDGLQRMHTGTGEQAAVPAKEEGK